MRESTRKKLRCTTKHRLLLLLVSNNRAQAPARLRMRPPVWMRHTHRMRRKHSGSATTFAFVFRMKRSNPPRKLNTADVKSMMILQAELQTLKSHLGKFQGYRHASPNAQFLFCGCRPTNIGVTSRGGWVGIIAPNCKCDSDRRAREAQRTKLNVAVVGTRDTRARRRYAERGN
jgi:hypothetical protein